LRQRWNFGPATAEVLAHQQGQHWRIHAHLQCKKGIFQLKLHQYNQWQSLCGTWVFDDWSEIAAYLERHTPLRLQDFRSLKMPRNEWGK
jgi:hypothetical protein